MTNLQVFEIIRTSIIVVTKLAGPLLFLSMAIGIVISILQAATQIHEQTITFVPKVVLIVIVGIAIGPWMLRTMQDFTMYIFDMMLVR